MEVSTKRLIASGRWAGVKREKSAEVPAKSGGVEPEVQKIMKTGVTLRARYWGKWSMGKSSGEPRSSSSDGPSAPGSPVCFSCLRCSFLADLSRRFSWRFCSFCCLPNVERDRPATGVPLHHEIKKTWALEGRLLNDNSSGANCPPIELPRRKNRRILSDIALSGESHVL